MCMLSERTQVLLTPVQRKRLERMAEDRRLSMGALIREAIDAYTVPGSRTPREAADALLSIEAPVEDWDEMKSEILRGAIG